MTSLPRPDSSARSSGHSELDTVWENGPSPSHTDELVAVHSPLPENSLFTAIRVFTSHPRDSPRYFFHLSCNHTMPLWFVSSPRGWSQMQRKLIPRCWRIVGLTSRIRIRSRMDWNTCSSLVGWSSVSPLSAASGLVIMISTVKAYRWWWEYSYLPL